MENSWQLMLDGDVENFRNSLEQNRDFVHGYFREFGGPGGSPLSYLSVHGGKIKILQILLDHGADIDRLNGNGEPPLESSIKRGHFKIAKFLIKNGANVDLIENADLGIVLALENGNLEIAETLLQSFLKDYDGPDELMLLYFAVFYNKMKAVKFLILIGADIDIDTKDSSGYTILDYDRNNKMKEILRQGALALPGPKRAEK